MKKSAIAVIAGLALLSACSIGKNAADLPVARSASGTMAALQAASGAFTVELLAVRDDGLVVQDNSRRILFFPYGAIRLFTPRGLGREYILARGEVPSSSRRAMLRAVSHYPQGLNDALERKLLDIAGQRELLTLQ